MDKKQSKRESFSAKEKFDIMYKYLVENNAFKTGIRARTMYEDYPIGQWQARLRTAYYNGTLDLDEELERDFLDAGILRKEKERETADRLTWDEKYKIMSEYLATGQPIEYTTVYKGYKLGQWQTVLRHLFYTNTLTTVSSELKRKFFRAGILRKEKVKPIQRGSTKTSYDKKFEIMYRFLETSGFEKSITQDTIFEGHHIGSWQDNLRQTYRKGRDLLMAPELLDMFFGYGILRESDINKRKENISKKQSIKTTPPENSDEIEQMVALLLRKQEERKSLDAEIAELEEQIKAKTR